MQRVELEDVHVSFGDKVALEGVSASFTRGGIECLLGPNSAGKSVLARTLCLLQPAGRGRVLWDGEDVSSVQDPTPLIRRTSYMIQKPVFLRGDVWTNVAMPLRIHGEDLGRVDRYLKLFGLSDIAHDDPLTLSGGMQQRVSLVRALVTEPELLVLDEPTSSIDPETKLWMEKTILSLQERSKSIVIWITHDIGQAFRVASRLTLLRRGQVVFTGSPSEAIDDPLFAEQRRYLSLEI